MSDRLRPDDVPPPPDIPEGQDTAQATPTATMARAAKNGHEDSLLDQILQHEKRRAALDIPQKMKIGEKEYSLVSRSLGLYQLVWDEVAKLGGSQENFGAAVLRSMQELRQGEAEAQEQAADRLVSSLIEAKQLALRKCIQEETDAYVRIAQLMVEPRGKRVDDPDHAWALPRDAALWDLGMDDLAKLLRIFLIRDVAGLSFVSKKAVELGEG